MGNEGRKILVVEDEFITAADLISNLEDMGFIVPASTDSGEDVIGLAQEHDPDLILMDINLKRQMDGITAADLVKKQLDIPVVFLTGQSDEATIQKAIASEPFGYIIKPFDERTLKTTIAMALYKHSLDQQVKSSEVRYRQIAESSNDLIIILNEDQTIDYINISGMNILSKNINAILGKPIQEFIGSDDLPILDEHMKAALGSPVPARCRMYIHLSDKEFWLDSTFTAIPGYKEKSIQILWIGRDVTHVVRIQKAIEKEGIQQIEKNMEQFQILNDQIRNPLTVIASIVSLDEGPYTDKILEQVQRIDDLVTRLDDGWIESNKVRSFLMRHFRHGMEL